MSAHVTIDSPDTWPAKCFAGPKPFCDLVMKGGVTSGVVYPFAICRIAAEYVIRNIGGTSVGAIAAAITAAAEYRRRGPDGTGDGYVELAKLPAFLARDGNLVALFAADEDMAPYLDVALAFVQDDPAGKPLPPTTKFVNAAKTVFRSAWPTLCLTFVLTTLLDPLTWLLILRSRDFAKLVDWAFGIFDVAVGLAAVVLAALLIVKTWLLRGLKATGENGFGWAHGHTPANGTPPPVPRLIDWLAQYVQRAAGLPETAPLTFGDLKRAGRSVDEPRTLDDEDAIQFRVVTTCLTLNRPFELPFDMEDACNVVPGDTVNDESARGEPRPPFYFKPDELGMYFPAEVMAYLQTEAVSPRHATQPAYRRFPAESDLPVVLAARMSMSFPILFTAVKLYAPDRDGSMRALWFSDGGLTRNMPIRFFDAPLPRWPTFAIDLLGSDPAKKTHHLHQNPGDYFIEGDIDPGDIEPWDRLDKSVVAFIGAIIETARTWQDRLLGHMPGYSDRTVGIRLHDNEGGVRLTMPPPVIAALTDRGNRAGALLMGRFAGPGRPGWLGQRWTRYRNVMTSFADWLRAFERGYRYHDPTLPSPPPPSASYPQQVSTTTAPVPYSHAAPFASADDAKQAQTDTFTVDALRGNWTTDFDRGAAEPAPRLRSSPRF